MDENMALAGVFIAWIAIETIVNWLKYLCQNAPRKLDLDILLCGEEKIQTEILTIPNPSMWRWIEWIIK